MVLHIFKYVNILMLTLLHFKIQVLSVKTCYHYLWIIKT